MLCLIIRREEKENMANLTVCRGREHEEKCNVGKRFTVGFFPERDRTFTGKVVESACYTSIYVFDTKRLTSRFKVRKALNNKFVCVVITCKVYRN